MRSMSSRCDRSTHHPCLTALHLCTLTVLHDDYTVLQLLLLPTLCTLQGRKIMHIYSLASPRPSGLALSTGCRLNKMAGWARPPACIAACRARQTCSSHRLLTHDWPTFTVALIHIDCLLVHLWMITSTCLYEWVPCVEKVVMGSIKVL